ncbi:hypothetical protein HMPREF1861_00595 [Corynebacterium kroppenstedtii]|nr:hypothetical protein HMPREF1861_00595 [Corynebacterium kroppenstedtii]MCF7181991.1 hypothetical protein [Corynebacterium parakroppenstedtii]
MIPFTWDTYWGNAFTYDAARSVDKRMGELKMRATNRALAIALQSATFVGLGQRT